MGLEAWGRGLDMGPRGWGSDNPSVLFIYLSKAGVEIRVPNLVYLQSFMKYLRQALLFVWDSALLGGFNFCFSGDFY